MSIMKSNIITALAVVAFALVAGAAEKHWLGTDATNPTLASVAANWSPAGAPTDMDDVVLDAGSNNNNMTWDLDNGVNSWTQSDYTGTVTFKTGVSATYSGNTYTAYGETLADGTKAFTVRNNVTLSSGAWTHEATPAMTSTGAGLALYKNGTGVYRLVVIVGGDFRIAATAALDVTAKGFNNKYSYGGPGYGNDNLGGPFACHGGIGSCGASSAGPAGGGSNVARCYGSIAMPLTIGSARSSTGGGSVQLEVGGDMVLEGDVLAKSGPAANYSGSGGSIYIHAKTLSGRGTVSASSGASSYPGGGGRVAIWINKGNFTTFSPDRVTANAASGDKLSTPGTVFLWALSDADFGARLYVRGNATIETSQVNYRYTCTPISAANTNELPARLKAVVLSDGANLGVGNDVALGIDSVTASQSSTAKPRLTMFGGSLSVPDGFMVDGYSLLVYGEDASVDVEAHGTMGLASSNSIVIDRPFSVDGSLFVTGTVSHSLVSVASTNILDLSVSGDMEVASGGMIDVSNCGWGPKLGPGAGTEAGVGGVYAGTVPGSGKHAYGNPILPLDHGSGGYSARGGGVAKLTVDGTFTLNGMIRAYSSNNNNSGGGSGGSVWITAGELAASGGSIDAKGASYAGTAAQPGGGGSGGRVSICQTVGGKTRSEWGVSITVAGGSSTGGTTSGGGTVYWEKASDGEGHGTLSTSGGNAVAAPELPSSTEADPQALADVKLSVGNVLRLSGDMTVGDFSLPKTSTIYLNGHTLTVASPANRRTQSVLGTVDTGDGGKIVWPQHGMMLLFR